MPHELISVRYQPHAFLEVTESFRVVIPRYGVLRFGLNNSEPSVGTRHLRELFEYDGCFLGARAQNCWSGCANECLRSHVSGGDDDGGG